MADPLSQPAQIGLRCEASPPAAAPPSLPVQAGLRWDASADLCKGPVRIMLCSATRFVSTPATPPTILSGGEKAIICGVNGVRMEVVPKASPTEDTDSSDGLPPGAMPSLSKSKTSSLSMSTLRPRRCASAPAVASSNELGSPDEELGEVARVLVAEVPLFLPVGRSPRSTTVGGAGKLNMGPVWLG